MSSSLSVQQWVVATRLDTSVQQRSTSALNRTTLWCLSQGSKVQTWQSPCKCKLLSLIVFLFWNCVILEFIYYFGCTLLQHFIFVLPSPFIGIGDRGGAGGHVPPKIREKIQNMMLLLLTGVNMSTSCGWGQTFTPRSIPNGTTSRWPTLSQTSPTASPSSTLWRFRSSHPSLISVCYQSLMMTLLLIYWPWHHTAEYHIILVALMNML